MPATVAVAVAVAVAVVVVVVVYIQQWSTRSIEERYMA